MKGVESVRGEVWLGKGGGEEECGYLRSGGCKQ